MSALSTNPPDEPRGRSSFQRGALAANGDRRPRKLAGRSVLAALIALAAVAGALAGLTLVYSVNLPQIDDLQRYRPSTTTDLYDVKGRKIGSFALERRIVLNYEDFSPVLRQAVISIEDKSFEKHWGVNVLRIGGALWYDLRTHGRAQGASTLTMQLARNLFLSSRRTAGRKIQEAFLAIQIERTFTKQQIFTLYGNQIYLGHGMYGFEAGAQFYFGKRARDLSLPEAALLAGLPKAPVSYSPLLNPEKSLRRRNLVLSEMESDGLITHAQAAEAQEAPLGLRVSQPEASLAPWFQEEVRQELEKRFGVEQVHEAGLRVDTSLDLDLQRTANRAVLDGLAAYERRHGWKAKLDNALDKGATLEGYKHPDWIYAVHPGDYAHALVQRVSATEIYARVGGQEILLGPEDWRWTGRGAANALVRPGDLIYVKLAEGGSSGARRASLEQDSGAQGALLLMDNLSGNVLAMVGGRDYALSQFNRAVQAERQTGSSFKPYVYTAAIEDGVKPTDRIVDSPVSYGSYSPHNYENDYKGSMSIEEAFAESRNVPAVKLAARVGIHKVIDLAHRFGVTATIPAYLPVALGAAEVTLIEQVAAYSVFPNDGLLVKPRMVRKVTNADGVTLWEDKPTVSEAVSQDTARSMMTLLRAVTRRGTGAAAAALNHPVGGKTGTTSDYTDAWFLGFSPSVTCGVWVGFDAKQSLGEKETGARAALPIWMTVMRAAFVGRENESFASDASPSAAPAVSPSPPAASAKGAVAPQAAPRPPQKPASPAAPTPAAPRKAPEAPTIQPKPTVIKPALPRSAPFTVVSPQRQRGVQPALNE